MIFKRELERMKAELEKKLEEKREEVCRINRGVDSTKNKREAINNILTDMEILEKSIAGANRCLNGNGVCFIATLRMEGEVFDVLICENALPIFVENDDRSLKIISEKSPLSSALLRENPGPGEIISFDVPNGGKKKAEVIDTYTP